MVVEAGAASRVEEDAASAWTGGGAAASGEDEAGIVVGSVADAGSTLACAGVAYGTPGVLVSTLAVWPSSYTQTITSGEVTVAYSVTTPPRL